MTSPPIAASQPEVTHSNNASTAQQGTRKLLSSLRNLLDVSNKVGHCLPLNLSEGQTKYSILYLYICRFLSNLFIKYFPGTDGPEGECLVMARRMNSNCLSYVTRLGVDKVKLIALVKFSFSYCQKNSVGLFHHVTVVSCDFSFGPGSPL